MIFMLYWGSGAALVRGPDRQHLPPPREPAVPRLRHRHRCRVRDHRLCGERGLDPDDPRPARCRRDHGRRHQSENGAAGILCRCCSGRCWWRRSPALGMLALYVGIDRHPAAHRARLLARLSICSSPTAARASSDATIKAMGLGNDGHLDLWAPSRASALAWAVPWQVARMTTCSGYFGPRGLRVRGAVHLRHGPARHRSPRMTRTVSPTEPGRAQPLSGAGGSSSSS